MRFNLFFILFAVFMLIGLTGIVYAYGDFDHQPLEGYYEPDTYVGFYSDSGYSIPSEVFPLGGTLYIKINSTDIANCNNKNQIRLNGYDGSRPIDSTGLFTCSNVGGRTICQAAVDLSPITTPDWYGVELQCGDGTNTVKVIDAIVVGSPTTPHYVRLYNDSSYTTESVWFNSSGRLYYRVYTDLGTYDSANTAPEFNNFLNTKDKGITESCTQNGNVIDCYIDISQVVANGVVTITEGNWYFFDPKMRDSANGKLYEKIAAMLIIDDTGPTTSNVIASPNPTEGASSVTVTATVDDSASNNATVNYVNYTVYQGNTCSGTVVDSGIMSPSDGAFDSSVEDVTATITTAGWTIGNNYTICITGRDIAYNFGPVASTTVEHRVSDSTPPTLTYVAPTPGNGAVLPYGTTSVTINASADEALGTCILEWNGVNETFAPTSSRLCTITKTVTSGGSYTYTLYASDIAGNIGSAGQRSFSVQDDTTAPTINSVSDSPDPVVQGQNITFTVNCFDDISGVAQVLIEFSGTNHTASGSEPTFTYEYNTSGMTPGTYNYAVYCSDAAGNMAYSSGYTFQVAPPVTYNVYGYVFNASNLSQPVQGASVALLSSGSVFKETTTNAQGFYNLSGVLAGTYDLVANITGVGSHWIRNLAVSSDIEQNMTLGAPRIWNHRPGGKVVNTSSDCSVCHKNSVMTVTWDTGGATADNYNATIHYVKEVTTLPGFTHNALDTTNCVQCHIAGGAYVKDPNWGTPWNASAPTSDPPGRPTWRQHNETTNAECVVCHGNVSSKDFHAAELTIAGAGPDCISCHDIGGSAPKHVNFTAVLAGVHGGINTTSTPGYEVNEPCYACHSSDGQPPASGQHPDRQKSPYVCTDCHLAGGVKAGAYGAPIVSEHYLNGSEIVATTGASTALESCLNCHQNASIPELRDTNNNDPDTGTFDADGDGVYGGAISAYHYGKISPVLNASGVANCSYCHQQSSSFDGVMQDVTHNNMLNHTDNVGGPVCTDCHGSGRMHDSALTKPALTSSLCTSCHTTKQEHAGKVACANCHTQQARDIHGIKYIQSDGSYNRYSPGSPANCTTCHEGSGLGGAFAAAPKFAQFRHSDSSVAGYKWNKTSQVYWNTTLNACYFCHGDTKHSINAFGKIDDYNITGSNTKNSSITSTSYWCANCHYDASLDNYNGSAFSPKVVNISGWGLSSATDGTTYQDHIANGWVTPTDHGDSKCRACHGALIGGSATTFEFVHSVSVGAAGGNNCISCHDVGASTAPDVDFNATEQADAAHANLNSGVSTTLPAENKKCWACHYSGSGEPPAGAHPSGYNTPKLCEDCHTTGAYGAPLVKEHYKNGEDVKVTKADCWNCHSLSENQVSNVDNENPSHYTVNDTNKSYASHYVRVRSDLKARRGEYYCSYCHQQQKGGLSSPSYNQFFVNLNRTKQPDHSARLSRYRADCVNCHYAPNNLHSQALDIRTFTNYDSQECGGCHRAITWGRSHVSGMKCTVCHSGDGKLHNVSYLTKQGTFVPAKIARQERSYVTCYECHANNTLDTYLANKGYTARKIVWRGHGDGVSSDGSIIYWTDNSSACELCHHTSAKGPSTYHFDRAPIGAVAFYAGAGGDIYKNLNTTNFASSTWCGSCHITTDSDYYWTVRTYLDGLLKKKPPVIMPGSGNHTTLTAPYTDDKCATCHYSGSASDGMDAFIHGIQ